MRAAQVVVLGGGFAGLETAFSLASTVDGRAEITLVSNEDAFLFKPNTIYIPFGLDPARLLIRLDRPARRRDVRLIRATATDVDPAGRAVRLAGDHRVEYLGYDFLVIATGAAMAADEIPGLADHAETIWSPDDMLSLRARLLELVARAKRGESQTVLFAVPPNNKCSGPLYEIVLMLETWLHRMKIDDRVRLVFTTYEHGYIQAFGPKVDAVVRDEFAARGITGRVGERLVRVDPQHASYESGRTEPYDLLIAFPPYIAAGRFEGLTSDARGFLATDLLSRRVQGTDNVYAPGDAGDFPVKQAFLAFLEADAVADDIAMQILGTSRRRGFDPVSMCVMEELDKAAFAQVPLELTGDPEQPVAVRAGADGAYRVGVSPLWRLGKKALGVYLPMRFKAGRPFHAGAAWAVMDASLRVMSTLLART